MSKTKQWYINGLLEEDQEVLDTIRAECYPGVLDYIRKKDGTETQAKELFERLLNFLIEYIKEKSEKAKKRNEKKSDGQGKGIMKKLLINYTGTFEEFFLLVAKNQVELVDPVRNESQKPLLDLTNNNKILGMMVNYICNNSGTQEEGSYYYKYAIAELNSKIENSGSFIIVAKISTFLFSIVRNHWLKELRRRKVIGNNYNENLENIDSSDVEFSDTYIIEMDFLRNRFDVGAGLDEFGLKRVDIFKKCFNNLSEECKLIFKHYFEGLSVDDIATKLNTSNQAARVKKHRCKAALTKCVRDTPGFDELFGKYWK